MKKVCKNCKLIVAKDVCPICKGNQFTESWKGHIYIVDPAKSFIAKKMGITVKGEYALKIR